MSFFCDITNFGYVTSHCSNRIEFYSRDVINYAITFLLRTLTLLCWVCLELWPIFKRDVCFLFCIIKNIIFHLPVILQKYKNVIFRLNNVMLDSLEGVVVYNRFAKVIGYGQVMITNDAD